MKQFSLAQTAAELVQTGGRMLAAGLVAGHDGNISVRLNEQEILVTPAGKSKGELGPADLLLVDLQGRVLSHGPGRPTSELPMHLRVYQADPAARAVLHAHSPYATAFALAGRTLQSRLPEVTECLGDIPLLPFAEPGTQQLADGVGQAVAQGARGALLAEHGCVVWGDSLSQALYRLEEMELACKIEWLASFLK